MEDNKEALSSILAKYGVPDPKIVGKLPKGGRQLDFVGHADVTKFLLEVDPNWRWVPIEWKDGRPAIHVANGMATMWGELTVLGQSRLGVGSVPADKADLDKELVSDFIRNAAMRFGFCLSLWTKQEWEDVSHTPQEPRKQLGSAAEPKPAPVVIEDDDALVDDEFRKTFEAACEKAGFTPVQVCAAAGLWWEELFNRDKITLRATFKVMKGDNK